MKTPRHERPVEAGPFLFVLGLVVGLLAALVADRLATLFADRDIELVRAVRNLALEEFVDEVDSRELVDDALRGMLEGLDPYSRFYGPEEVPQVQRETTGEFPGIGVVFRSPSTDGQILFAFPDSPAAQAGLGVGDRLVEVDGHAVAELEPGGLQRVIQAERSGPLELLVLDLSGERRRVKLEPRPVVDPTIRHTRMLNEERGIAYLCLLSFSRRTPDEFDAALEELAALGMKSLIVDLRFNPGGMLESAVRVANRFIGEGTIVATRTRRETEVTRAVAEEARYRDLPLVVLIDGGSASASEVLAGALQDHCAAALVGESTYGKGTVQTLRHFSDNRGIVKFTTAHYYTPSGRGITRDESGEGRSGIAPDHVVEVDEAERRTVYGFLQTYSPPPSALPAIHAWEARAEERFLTPPPPDLQLEAAVALLSEADSPHAPTAH